MPPSAIISQIQAEECLAEGLSTLAALAYRNTIQAAIINLPNNPALQQPAIQPTEVQTIIDSLTPGSISSIGVSLFVYPYERYKKKLIAVGYPNFQQKASDAFTANTFNTEVNFMATFPASIVRVWAAPGGNPGASFAADSIRNSFAHGQSMLTVDHGVQMVEMWNSQNGELAAANFWVLMTLPEFWRLTQQCMNAFVTNAVQHGLLVPFQTLLNQLLL
jgi:hypothetical protein